MNIQKIRVAVCITLHAINLQSSHASGHIVIHQHPFSSANNSFTEPHSLDSHSSAVTNGSVVATTVSNDSVGPHSLPSNHSIQSSQCTAPGQSMIKRSNETFVDHYLIDTIKNAKRTLSLFKQKYDPNAYTQKNDAFDKFLRRMYITTVLASIQEHAIPYDHQQPTTKIQRRHMHRLTTKQNAIMTQLTQLLESLQTKKPTSAF